MPNWDSGNGDNGGDGLGGISRFFLSSYAIVCFGALVHPHILQQDDDFQAK